MTSPNAVFANLDALPARTVILDGDSLRDSFHLPVQPDLTIVIRAPKNAERLAGMLQLEYPADHELTVQSADGAQTCLTVSDLAAHRELVEIASALFIPALPANKSFEYFQDVVAILRSPGGCPWDRKQTHQSIRDDFLQEAYELIDGLDRLDLDMIREELGDILLHIVLQAQMAAEDGEFTMGDVLESISEKIIFRHQHVFDKEELTSDQVVDRWEKMKKLERAKNNKKQGLLDGISKAMPALSMAFGYQKRAARVGFDWDTEDDVRAKIAEELAEFDNAATAEEKEAEFGDILFSLVNLARWHKIDPETALRMTNLKFANRFNYVEKRAAELGKDLFAMPLAEKDALWEEKKRLDAETL